MKETFNMSDINYNFFSMTFGENVMSRLGHMTQDDLGILLEEIADEIEANEIGLKGNTDRDNTSYLIARRRHAKWARREVLRIREERFPKPPTDSSPVDAAGEIQLQMAAIEVKKLKEERLRGHDRQFLDHVKSIMTDYPSIWERITSSFKPFA